MDEPESCANCGSSAYWEECETCGGDGYIDIWDEEYGYDDTTRPCDICFTKGGWWRCMSSPEWCASHPLSEASAPQEPR